MNIGVRQPSEQWHLGHLYQPRAFVPGSIMPSYPSCSRPRPRPTRATWSSICPRSRRRPAGGGGAARAVDLVRYLQSLDRSYPVLAAPATTP